MIINERLKELRQLNRYTLKEVADRLGVSEGTVQRYESGFIKVVPYEHITTLADFYDVDPEYIAGWSAEYRKSDLKEIKNLDDTDKALLKAFHAASKDTQDGILMILGIKRE